MSLIRLENLNFEILQNGENVIDLLLVLDGLRQGLVDVVEREVALLLGLADQLADLLIDAAHSGGRVDPVGSRRDDPVLEGGFYSL
jgi:hypothetical protein